MKDILMKKSGKKFVIDRIEEQNNPHIFEETFRSIKSPVKIKSVGMKVQPQPLDDFIKGFTIISNVMKGL